MLEPATGGVRKSLTAVAICLSVARTNEMPSRVPVEVTMLAIFMRSPSSLTPQKASLSISLAERSVSTLSKVELISEGSLKARFQPMACSRTAEMNRCCLCIRPKSMFLSWRVRQNLRAFCPSRSW